MIGISCTHHCEHHLSQLCQATKTGLLKYIYKVDLLHDHI